MFLRPVNHEGLCSRRAWGLIFLLVCSNVWWIIIIGNCCLFTFVLCRFYENCNLTCNTAPFFTANLGIRFSSMRFFFKVVLNLESSIRAKQNVFLPQVNILIHYSIHRWIDLPATRDETKENEHYYLLTVSSFSLHWSLVHWQGSPLTTALCAVSQFNQFNVICHLAW